MGALKMGYLKEYERYIIETMLKDGKSVKEIATRLNRCLSTVYNEIKRGTVELLNSDLTTYTCYCADVSQRKYDDVKHNKGTSLKIGSDLKTVRFIEGLVNNQKYSPYAVCCELKSNSDYTYLCTSTIYHYIHNGVFLNLNDSSLHYNTLNKKDSEKLKRPSYKKLGAKSIELRPDDVAKRSDFGNWELDTVYSGKNTSLDCLLVFTERLTRRELIFKLKDRTSFSVLNKFNELEKSLGYDTFKSTFKTITCDNGVEFSRFKDLEHSCINNSIRTQIYFCHPFNSCERGSNENANKLIRKFIKKGTDISLFSDSDIENIQNFINNYPRKLFNGLSSNQYSYQLGLL
jgi:IS30 family transposase